MCHSLGRVRPAVGGSGLLAMLVCLWQTGVWLVPPCLGQIPEPDNVVYGQIVIATNLVTAQRTNVMVEVRNGSGGVLSSYRMGDDVNLGNYYAVPVSFWSPGEAPNPLPPPTGQTLSLLVKERVYVAGRATNLVRYETNFVVGDRGYVQQIDFGAIVPASGFEAWAAASGLAPGSQNLDADSDGFSNGREFVAGTNPHDPNSRFVLAIDQGTESVAISFVALQTLGAGYAGLNRYYALETALDPQGPWTALPDYQNMPGDGQIRVCVVAVTNGAPQFYRGQVDLR